jgi:hypothetical protein
MLLARAFVLRQSVDVGLGVHSLQTYFELSSFNRMCL